MWISLWVVTCVFISIQSAKSQGSLTNVTQQTNQLQHYKVIFLTNSYADFRAVPECRDYDAKLISDIANKWFGLLDTNRFHHPDNGTIVARFKLHQDGNVSDIKISGNTNALVAPFCIQAIKDCSPFPKWPDKMRSIVGQDYREINYTFNLNPL